MCWKYRIISYNTKQIRLCFCHKSQCEEECGVTLVHANNKLVKEILYVLEKEGSWTS